MNGNMESIKNMQARYKNVSKRLDGEWHADKNKRETRFCNFRVS